MAVLAGNPISIGFTYFLQQRKRSRVSRQFSKHTLHPISVRFTYELQ